jgi:hypothetical protein
MPPPARLGPGRGKRHPIDEGHHFILPCPFGSLIAPALQIHLMKKHRQVAGARALIAVDALRALPDRCLPAGWGCGRQTTARVVELRRARSEAL